MQPEGLHCDEGFVSGVLEFLYLETLHSQPLHCKERLCTASSTLRRRYGFLRAGTVEELHSREAQMSTKSFFHKQGHLCRASRIAAVRISLETKRASRRGIAAMKFAVKFGCPSLWPHDMKLKVLETFSRQMSCYFSPDNPGLQRPKFTGLLVKFRRFSWRNVGSPHTQRCVSFEVCYCQGRP